jgi:hypothetical protein
MDAPTALSKDGDLLVTIPEHAPLGTSTLALETPGGNDHALITVHPKPTVPTARVVQATPAVAVDGQLQQLAYFPRKN